MGFSISIDLKRKSYNSILVIVNWDMKIDHYKLVIIIINAPGLIKIIINIIVSYHGFLNLIVINWGLLFTSKFWSLLWYFLGIKQKLSTIFYP